MVRSCHHGQFVDVHSGDGAMSDIGEGEQVLVAVRVYTERQSSGLYFGLGNQKVKVSQSRFLFRLF